MQLPALGQGMTVFQCACSQLHVPWKRLVRCFWAGKFIRVDAFMPPRCSRNAQACCALTLAQQHHGTAGARFACCQLPALLGFGAAVVRLRALVQLFGQFQAACRQLRLPCKRLYCWFRACCGTSVDAIMLLLDARASLLPASCNVM